MHKWEISLVGGPEWREGASNEQIISGNKLNYSEIGTELGEDAMGEIPLIKQETIFMQVSLHLLELCRIENGTCFIVILAAVTA